ncbi:transporter substrate-binding domain-containing protein, partial [Salmonella enterica]|nr:transporter substrate-binding domain-containing protein [Salmonella enterica]
GVLTEFGSLIPGLQAKRFDIIAAGMYVTPERCGQVAFSNPTYGVGQAFLVKQGNPKNLHSYEDVVKNPDAKLGVVVGAIEAEYASKVKVPAG